MTSATMDDEDLTVRCCVPLTSLTSPVDVGQFGAEHAGKSTFMAWPLFGPLLFDNESSDARDHCANERSDNAAFLSYLRLSVYMAVMSVAITLSFHLKHTPTEVERAMAFPLGTVFWVLSALVLLAGVANYIITVNKYSQKVAIVQTGWRTQLILGIAAVSIVGTSIMLLVITQMRRNARE
ncbi:hypothetical protein S7711_00338 [Stachybotrys chartarum IBT 7711]|uniref:DUF202 domain-containing protein n=1 Tax=Stachybotrys chartarum (strain CBS 109288 / IBT 7711) TaxID=1280523 RepID=A0A084B9E9_STACB|nr:hypothetical protein S7711_00338 [Stachybotrys chartarum IBT 7711]KFA55494.1 hypothetical protein S40293_02045 [Stachybotrys chartarum IBT 40293]